MMLKCLLEPAFFVDVLVIVSLASDVVHVPDRVLVLLQDVVAFELQGGAQFAAGNTKVCGKNDKLLDPLSVGSGLAVGAVDSLLNCAHQSVNNDAAILVEE